MKPRTAIINGVAALVAVGVGIAGYAALGKPSSTKVTTTVATVSKGNVSVTVSATGNALAAQQLSLNFGTTGKLAVLNVNAGDKVTKGQVLAQLDDKPAQTALATAKLNLGVAQAKLAQLQAGPSSLDLQQSSIAQQQAHNAVVQAQQNLNNAQATANLNASNYQAGVDSAQNTLNNDQATLTADTNQQNADQDALNKATADVTRLTNDQNGCPQEPNDPGVSCANVAGLLTTAKAQVTTLTSAVGADKQKVATDTAKVASDQGAVNNAKSSQSAGVLKDQQSVTNAQNQLASAKLSEQNTVVGNQIKNAPAKDADLLSAQAAVTQAQSQLDTAQQNVDYTVLTAPVAGTIASVANKVGENVGTSNGSSSSSSNSSSSAFIVLTDLSTVQVKAGFAESDATQLKVGQTARITFDALVGQTFNGKLTAVDTTQTVSQNVVTYNGIITLDQAPPDVKPGMTSQVTVTINSKSNVLTLPSSAVSARGSNALVQVQGADNKTTSKAVQLGLKGDDSVEIVSGLNEGDKVVVQSSAVRTGTGTNNTANNVRLPGGVGGGGGVFVGGRGG